MAVEVGAVDTGDLDLVAYLYAAAAAHSGAVDHERVEAHHGLDARGARCVRGGLHHDGRADGNALVDVGVALQRGLDANADVTLQPGGAVVGAHNQVVA